MASAIRVIGGPLAIVLAKNHTVIVPDLRGMGMSDQTNTLKRCANQVTEAHARKSVEEEHAF
jgi:pimeloyl-ACP methyl ester carboxylesterase